LQSLTEDVARQTEREKQLQQRYAELVEELKELSREGTEEVVLTNGNGVAAAEN
jgi:pre-mRNA-splicing factor CDC5/CEF1